MGQQIIQQPDGRYAIFSSNTDTILMHDATEDEVVEWFVDREVQRTREHVQRVLGHVAAGNPEKVYYQFATTWEEALEKDREHGGDVSQERKP